MRRVFSTTAILLLAAGVCAAQGTDLANPYLTAASTPAATVSTPTLLGVPLDMAQGPWVVGEVVFQGARTISAYTLNDQVRARRGMLYTPDDVQSDLKALKELTGVLGADAQVYGIPEQPIPDSYKTIAVSTMMARIVYSVTEKEIQLPGLTTEKTPESGQGKKKKPPPAPHSGVVMTPTAYRSINQYNRPGLGLDVNAVYFIGRLYGKNNVDINNKTNYLDRVGVWFLSADGKMQLQSETRWRPAMAMGARGILAFRDAPQPAIQQPGVAVQVTADTTRVLSDYYLVFSKKVKKVITSAGYSYGSAGDRYSLLSEFLTPTALLFAGHPDQEAKSKDVLFGSVMTFPKPHLPLGIEFAKPNGMALSPWIVNLKVGYFLKLNFDLAYMRFRGGWDMLGMFQFRYTQFPRTVPRKKT